MWLDDMYYSNDGITEPHTVTASSGAGGSISPSGPQTVAHGASSPVFSIVPNSDYAISAVLVDGVSVGTPATYQFTNVTADHTISATFVGGSLTDMAIQEDCSLCHGGYHHTDIDCVECHTFPEKHPGATGTALHTPADVTSCTPCHNSSLTVEHMNRTPTGGGAFECITCHQSADPLVVAAISTRNSACSACHAGAGHATAHTFTADSDVVPAGNEGCTNSGPGCHGMDATRSNFVAYHPTAGCTTGACHTSPSKASPRISKNT